MTVKPIDLPKVGELAPKYFDSGELLCFARRIQFRNCSPELIVYPAEDGVLPRESMQDLSSRYFRFLGEVDVALIALPKLLRAECQNYEITVDHLSDSELIANLEWENIKLDPSGTVECYARNVRVTANFDIAIGFDKAFKL